MPPVATTPAEQRRLNAARKLAEAKRKREEAAARRKAAAEAARKARQAASFARQGGVTPSPRPTLTARQRAQIAQPGTRVSAAGPATPRAWRPSTAEREEAMGFDYYDPSVIGSLTRLVDYATGIPTAIKDPSAANIGWAASNFIPFGRGARAIKAAGDPLRASVRGGRGMYGTRAETYRGLPQQMTSSPSLVTAQTQRGISRASTRLGGIVDVLRDSEKATVRALGQAITPVSARGRVPREAGKGKRRDQAREQAALAPELELFAGHGMRNPIRKAEGAEAHFWWAQVDEPYRNNDTLRQVVGKLREEQDFYASGRALAELKAERAELLAQMKAVRESGDTRAFFKLRGQSGELKAAIADIPARTRDLGASIERVERAIKANVELRPELIEKARTLMDDRTARMVAAKKLDPEDAADRVWRVSDWLGHPRSENLAGPVYLGHRMGDVPGTRPASVSTGRTRLPRGLKGRNELGLVKTGRARTDLNTVAQDWLAAQVYDFHIASKDDLWKMGEPIGALGPKPGSIIVNPEGHRLIPHWKQDEDTLQDVTELLGGDIEEYLTKTFAAAGTKDAVELMRQAAEHGIQGKLRQVPPDVFRRYLTAKVDPKVITRIHPLLEDPNRVTEALKAVTDSIYASLIYFNLPGYPAAAAAGNLGFVALDQGLLAAPNLLRATELAIGSKKDEELRRLWGMVLNEMGPGGGKALFSGGKNPVSRVVNKPARAIAAAPDMIPRVAAFLHEAAGAGVISRLNPYLSKAERQRLVGLFNAKNRGKLNDIASAAQQSVVKFDRLGPREKRVADTGIMFVWRWLRGATAYPFEYAAAHPFRTAAMAGAAYKFQDELKEHIVGEEAPPQLQQGIKWGSRVVQGEEYPKMLPSRPFSPVSTPLDMWATLTDQPGARTPLEMVNPGFIAAAQIAGKRGPYWNEADSYGQAGEQIGKRLVPELRFIQEMLNPPETVEEAGLYPQDTSAWGRFLRSTRVYPIAINPGEAREGAVRSGTAEDKVLDPRRTHLLERNAITRIQEKVNIIQEVADPEWQEPLTRAVRIKEDVKARIAANALEVGAVEESDEARIYLETVIKERPEFAADARETLEMLDTFSPEQLKKVIELARADLEFVDVFGKQASSVISDDLRPEWNRQNEPLVADLVTAFG